MSNILKFLIVILLIGCSFLFVSRAKAVPVISGRVLNTDGTPYIFQGSTTSGEYTKRVSVNVYKTYNGIESLIGGGSASNETGEFSTSLYSLGDVSFPKTVYIRLDSTVYGVDSYAYFDFKSVILNSGEDKVNVGDVQLKTPNVQGRLTEADGELAIGDAGIFFYNSESALTRRAMAKTDANGNFSFYIEPGSNKIRFTASAVKIDNLKEVEFTVEGQSVINLGVIKTDQSSIPQEEIYLPDLSLSPNIPLLLGQINRMESSKGSVGLNAHLGLQGADYDSGYRTKFNESGTKWVREHFDISTDPTGSVSWKRRYNKVINWYRDNGINVVGMLAYGLTAGDYSQPENLTEWTARVKSIVEQWGDYIRVWEVWNEPDLDRYLQPNTVGNYIPILKAGYEAIKSVDPDALVLNGPTSWPNATFLEGLYEQAKDYFDEPVFHVYYCDQYKKDGNNRQLQVDFAKALAVVNKYRSSDNIWITELGCSTYDGYTEEFQREYFEATIPYLLSTNRVEKILIYNIIDRSIGDPYEDNFGLLRTDFSTKPSWDWYLSLSGGTSIQTTQVASGTTFFAYNENLRGGYHITAGNVLGDGADEIITGTGNGLGPQVRVFDKDGNVKSQFWAYFSFLRSGVRLATCDLTGDGVDEIITAPGPGGRPHIRIFDGYGTALTPGFFALDGQFKGGAYVACGDVDGNGENDIVVTAGRGGGAHVTIHNKDGDLQATFFAYDKNTYRYGIKVTTADIDADGKDEIVTGPEYGSPHIQIFQVRPGEIKQLSPGFYAFSPQYRGGVSVGGADIDGDGTKELMVGVGDNARSAVKVYNIKEVVQKQFYAYATNFLGGVNVAGGDVDGDGTDEVLTIPRGSGGPNVKIIEASAI